MSLQLSSDKSLKDKLGVDIEEFMKDSNGGKDEHFNDGLSDDEEYQNMSEKERNDKMRSKLNVDGANDATDSDSDFETPPESPEVKKRKRARDRTKRRMESDSDADEAENGSVHDDDESMELPDIPEDEDDDNGKKVEPEKEKPRAAPSKIEDILTEEQKKNLVIPSTAPAVCGVRRRPTLLVTPSTLIPHWLEQIQTHVDPRVELKVFVHHGTSKAHIPAELERQDIVLTTYGTLAAEHNTMSPPLLSTRCLI